MKQAREVYQPKSAKSNARKGENCMRGPTDNGMHCRWEIQGCKSRRTFAIAGSPGGRKCFRSAAILKMAFAAP